MRWVMVILLVAVLMEVFAMRTSACGGDNLKDVMVAFTSDNWPEVYKAKRQLESLQEKAIPALLELLNRKENVPLKNTADLIYPGAKEYYGHGLGIN